MFYFVLLSINFSFQFRLFGFGLFSIQIPNKFTTISLLSIGCYDDVFEWDLFFIHGIIKNIVHKGEY